MLDKITKKIEELEKLSYYTPEVWEQLDELYKEKEEEFEILKEEQKKLEREKFGKIDFKEAFFLLDYCRKATIEGKLNKGALSTQDFAYGDWKSLLPQKWVNEEKDPLQKYYNTMELLQSLFEKLKNFQIDDTRHFSSTKLYILLPNSNSDCSDIIRMSFMIGQGSDFWLDLVTTKEWEKKCKTTFYLAWETALILAKKTNYEQAKFYYNWLVASSDDRELLLNNREKAMFLLGSNYNKSFPDILNFKNMKRKLV